MNKRYKNAAFIGVMSFVIQVVDRLLVNSFPLLPSNGLIYISFIAWGSYSLVNIRKKKVIKMFVNFTIGFITAYVMMLVGSWLYFAKDLTNPLVALIIVPIVMLLDILPTGINIIPIYFIGSGTFFALSNYLGLNVLKTFVIASIYILVGFIAAKSCDLYSERIKNGTN